MTIHTSWRVGRRLVASSYFLQASSSKASLVGVVESGPTLSALSCKPNDIDIRFIVIEDYIKKLLEHTKDSSLPTVNRYIQIIYWQVKFLVALCLFYRNNRDHMEHNHYQKHIKWLIQAIVTIHDVQICNDVRTKAQTQVLIINK